jgi:hypothetical protein
VRCDNLR